MSANQTVPDSFLSGAAAIDSGRHLDYETAIAKVPVVNCDPACPKCQRVPDDYWDAASDLSWNDSGDGEKETVTCPKCEAVYIVTQHVQRIVTRTAEIKTQP